MAAEWTAADDAKLTKLYEVWAGEVIPVEVIAKGLGRTPGAVRYRASKLGLTDPSRPRAARGKTATIVERECAHCHGPFTPRRPGDDQKTCSRSCAAKQRTIANRGRFRGGVKGPRVGKRPDIGPMNFRSAWEANYARYLNLLIATGEITRWEYEPEIFRFPVKRGNKGYLPDFRVWFPDGHFEWHEVKGYMDNASRIKLQRFALHHPEQSAVLKLIDAPKYRALVKEFGDLPGWEK